MAKLIHDIEDDYEQKHKDGWRIDPFTDKTVPVGLCKTMCSYEEVQERERHQRFSKYEAVPGSNPPRPDTKLMIKEFKRSCVGREFTHATELRPWSVLKKTLDHLLLDISMRDDDWMYICDFVFDRLKAVRQDMIIQRIEGKRYIEVLEGSVRFLLYSLYKLTCTLRDFTSSDETFEVIVPLEGRVTGLDNYEMNVVREMKLTYQCLRDCLNSLIIQYQEHVPDSKFRPLFESVYLIVNLPFLHGRNLSCSTEFQANKKLRNKYKTFRTVFEMYREHLSGNHVSAMKHLQKLDDHPLLIIAYAPVVAQLQVHMMHLLKKLYSASNRNVAPLSFIADIICPQWLEYKVQERVMFTEFLATQFGVFDQGDSTCVFKKASKTTLTGDQHDGATEYCENETRVFALQMVLGKDFSFYQDAIEKFGVASILDTNEPSDQKFEL